MAEVLEIGDANGATLKTVALDASGEWCLHWNHSVTGGPVADCFEIRSGAMVLTRSYMHDYAAGLGDMPGRGVQRPAERGGYWIEQIDEALPGNALSLRVGNSRVRHRVVHAGREIDLSAFAAGQRVTLRPRAQ